MENTFNDNEDFLAGMAANDILYIAADMMEEYQLNGGNAEIYYRLHNDTTDEVHVTLEAPGGSSVEVVYNVKAVGMKGLDTDELKKAVVEKMVHECRQFNVDERFEELWQAGDEYSVPELTGMLKKDEAFFKQAAAKWEKKLNDEQAETPEEICLNGCRFFSKGGNYELVGVDKFLI